MWGRFLFVLYFCFYFYFYCVLFLFFFWFSYNKRNVGNLWGCGASVCLCVQLESFCCVALLWGWPSWNRRSSYGDTGTSLSLSLSFSISSSFSLVSLSLLHVSLYLSAHLLTLMGGWWEILINLDKVRYFFWRVYVCFS